MEIKNFDFEVKATDDNTFEGYASTFYNKDAYDDIIEPGAFSKTIKERADKVKVLWQHMPMLPIGKPAEMIEDSKGLYVKARVSDTEEGKRAMTLIKDQVIDQLSIGFQTVKDEFDTDSGIRRLKELRLFEFSPVTFAANDQATITGAKNDNNLVPYLYQLTDEIKEGRVLSEGNKKLIEQAIQSLQDVLVDDQNNEQDNSQQNETQKNDSDRISEMITDIYNLQQSM